MQTHKHVLPFAPSCSHVAPLGRLPTANSLCRTRQPTDTTRALARGRGHSHLAIFHRCLCLPRGRSRRAGRGEADCGLVPRATRFDIAYGALFRCPTRSAAATGPLTSKLGPTKTYRPSSVLQDAFAVSKAEVLETTMLTGDLIYDCSLPPSPPSSRPPSPPPAPIPPSLPRPAGLPPSASQLPSAQQDGPMRFGILGCASIAVKFCQSVADSGDAVVYAVASRSAERAQCWATNHCAGAITYGSYQALLDDDHVQAVYLPLPTAVRTEWALKAVAKRKHILTEKPVAPDAAEALRIMDACWKSGVQYMDNSMFMHHARTHAIRKLMRQDAFGPPKCVTSSFSVCFASEEELQSNVRSQACTEPLGCLGDLGWYNVRFSLLAFDYEMPQAVSCHFHEATEDGVPLALTAVLRFGDSRTASFDCSFRLSLRQWAEVASASQTLSLDDFVVPQQENASFRVSCSNIGDRALYFPKDVLQDEVICDHKSQNARLVEHFVELARVADIACTAPNLFWSKVAWQTQAVLDACMKSGGKGGAWVEVASTPALFAGRARVRASTALALAGQIKSSSIAPFSEDALVATIDSLQRLAPSPLTGKEQLRGFLASFAHGPYDDWSRTREAAEQLERLLGGPETHVFRQIFGRVLSGGKWDEAQGAVAERGASKPWVVLLTGVNGIRKTSSVYQPWFKDLLRDALRDCLYNAPSEDLPDGHNSFFRQLDLIIATVANKDMHMLYAIDEGDEDEEQAYEKLKDAFFGRYRTLAEIVGVLLIRSARQRQMNVILESTGKDTAMFSYVDHFFPEAEYRKLVVHFHIDRLVFAERSVRARMLSERIKGRQVLMRSIAPSSLVWVNQGGSQGHQALRRVQATSNEVWSAVKEGSAANVGPHWLKAGICMSASESAEWMVHVEGSNVDAITFGPTAFLSHSQPIRVVVTGASGMLGRSLCRLLTAAANASSYEVTGLGYTRAKPPMRKLDLLDAAAVGALLDEVQPHVVVHAAAERDPDRAARDPARVQSLNVDVCARLASECARLNATLIYISTDYVFDGGIQSGISPPYRPDAPTAPLNLYGRSKLAGEQAVCVACACSVCARLHTSLRVSKLAGARGVASTAIRVHRIDDWCI